MMLTESELMDRLAVSQAGYELWRRVSMPQRVLVVQRLAACITEQRDELALEITRGMGKLLRESRREVDRCIRACETMPALAQTYFSSELIATENLKSYVCYQPLGVILGITPWNFPLWQVIRFAIPNILAGNSVVVKAAPNVFDCAEKLQVLFAKAGFPPGVFQSVRVDEASVACMIRDARICGVALTGSVRAGKAIARIAGENLKKVVLELGGSDPFIILDDANLDLAVANACQARFMNAGQICVAAKRLLVDQSLADEFIKRYIQAVSGYTGGDPLEEETNLAVLARQDLCNEIEHQVQESVKQGAKILIGGRRSVLDSCGYEATVLDNVSVNMPVFQEEVFGPVSAIMRFDSDEAMLTLANQTPYGLGATIWSNNRDRAEQLAMQLDCGMVYINSLLRSDIRLPFGGIKQSGYGKELGAAGFREFTNIKTVVVN